MPWVWMRTDDYPAMKRKMRQRSFFTRFPEAPVVDMLSSWHSMARPLRVARERLREARRVIDGVAMDMDDASYREDDCSHVRAMKKARDDLYAALRTP